MARHHLKLEEIEEKKVEAMRWQQKLAELDYKMSLIDRLAELRNKYPNITNEQIIRICPDMRDYVDVITNS